MGNSEVTHQQSPANAREQGKRLIEKLELMHAGSMQGAERTGCLALDHDAAIILRDAAKLGDVIQAVRAPLAV